MFKRVSIMIWVLPVLLGLLACTPVADTPPAETEDKAGMPNPASVYCEEQGGVLELRTSEAGTYGVCIFDDGSECEEWAYYRGECTPGSAAGQDSEAQESGTPDVGLANPAAVFCQEQGFRLESRGDESGVSGVCVFADGSECDEWAYWRGECGPASNETQVNIALEAGLPGTTKLEVLELDPAGESQEPYRLLLTIEDAFQLDDIVRGLNTATSRTPKTLCIPTFQLRFSLADGTVQELGYLCDQAEPTLSGQQDFWNNMEAAAPSLFVALLDSHLGRSQAPAPGSSLNVVVQAGLAGTQRIEVLAQTHSESDGLAQASIEPLADISDPAVVRIIVDSLNADLPVGPRARCIAGTILVFHLQDDSTYTMGYGCELSEASFLRGDEGFWQGQDLVAPPGFRELIHDAIAMSSLPPQDGQERAVAWYGRVVSSDQGDRLVLYPEGAGELTLVSDEDELEALIAELRDKPEPGRNAHFWGAIDCSSSTCTLIADRIRVDGPGTMFPPETVEGWQGTLINLRVEPGSGPDDAFVLAGDWPLQYGIWSEDPELAAQLESLRDTEQSFRIWGELSAGLPDANGTQIIVTAIEMVD